MLHDFFITKSFIGNNQLLNLLKCLFIYFFKHFKVEKKLFSSKPTAIFFVFSKAKAERRRKTKKFFLSGFYGI